MLRNAVIETWVMFSITKSESSNRLFVKVVCWYSIRIFMSTQKKKTEISYSVQIICIPVVYTYYYHNKLFSLKKNTSEHALRMKIWVIFANYLLMLQGKDRVFRIARVAAQRLCELDLKTKKYIESILYLLKLFVSINFVFIYTRERSW